ncbi:MAG: ABC transporter permease [Bacteroidota bacterium]
MSDYLILQSTILSLVLAITSVGIFISFRILKFPDLTCDGSFPLGGAVTAVSITSGIHPLCAILLALLGGGIAGYFVGTLNAKFKVPAVVASILVMTGLYSVNLFVLQRPQVNFGSADTVFLEASKFLQSVVELGRLENVWVAIILLSAIVCGLILALTFFLNSIHGLRMQMSGDSPKTALIHGVNSKRWTGIGLFLANSLIAFSGSLLAQYQGFADVNSGIGMVVTGLAGVFIGDALEKTVLSRKSIFVSLLFVLIGTAVYRFVLAFILALGVESTFTNVMTSACVLLAVLLPRVQAEVRAVFRR